MPQSASKTLPRLALLLTVGLILIVGLLTLTPVPHVHTVNSNDKLHHLLAFAAIVTPCALWNRPALIWLLPTAFVFGAAIEIIQPFVGRSRELMDLAANTAGIGIGALIALIAKQFSKS